MHDLSVRSSYRCPSIARTVERALALETDAIEGDRSRARVERDDDTVLLRIEADDPRALRAAKNTWFSLVRVAERTADGTDRAGAE